MDPIENDVRLDLDRLTPLIVGGCFPAFETNDKRKGDEQSNTNSSLTTGSENITRFFLVDKVELSI